MKAVIFDMDGVLIDSEPGYIEEDKKMFAALGIPFGAREIFAITGSSGRVVARRIKEWHPALCETEDELIELYLAGLMRGLRASVKGLIPGVPDWLARLKAAGARLAIASSSPRGMVAYVAETFGLNAFMEQIVTGDDVTLGKPWPDIFLLTAEKLGVLPRDCLVLEDSENGLRAAKAAGMSAFAFTGTNRHGLNLTPLADGAFDAFDEVNWKLVFNWLSV